MSLRLGTVVGSEFFFGLWPHWVELEGRSLNTHKHILGTTGSGKSKLIESLYLQSLKQGIPSTLVDPTGGSAEYLLSYLSDRGFFNDPASYDKLIYLEFVDGDYFFPLNLLKLPWASMSETAAIVIESFLRAYPTLEEVGPANFVKLMDAGIKALIANDLPLICLEELISVKAFRDRLLANVQDPHTVSFFRHNFDELIAYHRQAQSASTLNRAYDVVASNVLRHCLGQSENRLNVRDILDSGKFLIVNLGALKDHKTQRLLGAFLTHSFEMAAMSRPANSGLPPHQLMLDEFSAFSAQSTEALSTILTRTRQYGLFLTMAHQDWAQTNPKLEGALGGCGVKIAFRANPKDASLQAKAFADFDESQLKAQSPSGNPIMATVQDQYERWATGIKTLPDRQALVRIGTHKTALIQTPTLPIPSYDKTAVDAIKAEYYRRYYTHVSQINLPIGIAATMAQSTTQRPRIKP